MTHDGMDGLYELYALGVLEAGERAEIDSHLAAGCEVCRKYLGRARLTNAAILSLAPEAAPPRRVAQRLHAMTGAGRRAPGWLPWAAAFAALLAALSWIGLELNRRSSELAEARRILEITGSPETRAVAFNAGPRGNVYLNPRRGVYLVTANLPRLDPGRVLQMWVIPKDGAPRPAGLFRPNRSGVAVNFLPGPINLALTGAIAVSVEPESGSDAPTTQPIIVAPVGGGS
jgi:anti-sigma-K factor RskA